MHDVSVVASEMFIRIVTDICHCSAYNLDKVGRPMPFCRRVSLDESLSSRQSVMSATQICSCAVTCAQTECGVRLPCTYIRYIPPCYKFCDVMKQMIGCPVSSFNWKGVAVRWTQAQCCGSVGLSAGNRRAPAPTHLSALLNDIC
jgi:hypothetical protein